MKVPGTSKVPGTYDYKVRRTIRHRISIIFTVRSNAGPDSLPM